MAENNVAAAAETVAVGAVEAKVGSWVVAAGAALGEDGSALRRTSPVAEAGLSEEDARRRAAELGGRALDGARSSFFAARRADGDDRFAVEGGQALVPYDEAAGAASQGEEADGAPRAVLARLPLSAGAKAGIAAGAVAVVAAVAVAAALALGVGSPAPEAAPEAPTAQEQDSELTASDVARLCASLEFDGADVSAEGVSVEVENGRVMVVFASGERGKELVDLTARRSAALAAALEGEGVSEVVWVAVDGGGAVQAAVSNVPGEQPDGGSTADVVNGSHGHVIAGDVYEEAGGADEGYEASGGAPVTTPGGDPVEPGSTEPAGEAAPAEDGAAGSEGGPDADAQGGSQGGQQAQGGPQQGGSDVSGTQGGSAQQGGSGSSGSSAQQPAHQHTWVAQTTQQWVVDQAAWTETIPGSSYILCSCGQTFSSNAAWSSHNQSLGFGQSHSYTVVEEPAQTVRHPEVGHYETVTTGYVCSGCGATK